jgi:transcriptional regulator with XRE-family HTH domain
MCMICIRGGGRVHRIVNFESISGVGSINHSSLRTGGVKITMSKNTSDFERVRKMLNSAFLTWQRDQVSEGIPFSKASQTAFARLLGVPNTSWSQWVNGTRLPVGENIDKLANNKYIGPRIYTELGVPQRMPNDPDYRIIAESWYLLSKDQRKKMASYCQQILNTSKKEIRPDDQQPNSQQSRKQSESNLTIQMPFDGLEDDLD